MSLAREDIESLAKRLSVLSTFDSQSSGDAVSLYNAVCEEDVSDIPFGAVLKMKYCDTSTADVPTVLKEKFSDYMMFANFSGLSSSARVIEGKPFEKPDYLKSAIRKALYDKEIYSDEDLFLTDASVSEMAHDIETSAVLPIRRPKHRDVLTSAIAESLGYVAYIPPEFHGIANEMGIRQCGLKRWDHETVFLTAMRTDGITSANIKEVVERVVPMYADNIDKGYRYVGSEVIQEVISGVLNLVNSEQSIRAEVLGKIPRGFNLKYVSGDLHEGSLSVRLHCIGISGSETVMKAALDLNTGMVNSECSVSVGSTPHSIEIGSCTPAPESVFIPVSFRDMVIRLDLPSVTAREEFLNTNFLDFVEPCDDEDTLTMAHP